MAEWKKIIFENVKASLDGVTTTVDSDATSGDIGKVGTGAVAKLFASSSTPLPVLSGDLTVVISSSNGFAHTSSTAFGNTMASNPLSFPTVGGLDLSSGTSYDGTANKTTTVDVTQLSGAGLVDTDSVINVGAGNNITVNTNDVAVGTNLGDTDFGLKTVGNKLQIATGSGFKFGASGTGGALIKLAPNVAGGVKGANLSGGTGVTVSNTTFDFEDAETVSLSVDDFTGTGLVSTDNNLNLATASLLEGTGSKWNGSALANTNISFGTNTLLLAGTKVLAPGTDFNVQGTANYAHESDVEISDKILLINSASSQFGATAKFGFLGQTGSAAHGISLFYSGSGTAGDIGWNVGTVSNIGTNEPGTKKGRVRMHIGQAEAEPNTLTLTNFQKSTGNSYFDTGDSAGGFYVYVA